MITRRLTDPDLHEHFAIGNWLWPNRFPAKRDGVPPAKQHRKGEHSVPHPARRGSGMRKDLHAIAFLLILATVLATASSCSKSRPDAFVQNPQALIDSVLARYGVPDRRYTAEGQVIVPTDEGHGYFPLRITVHEPDSARILVERGRPQWIRVDISTIRVKRLPGKPMVLWRNNVNHEPVQERELYVLLPDIFSWLLDTYQISSVIFRPDSGYRVTALPRKSFSPVGRIEIDVLPELFQVKEVRIYSKAGDLGGRIHYEDFTRGPGYWIPRSIAVDFVVGGHIYDELYRLLRYHLTNPRSIRRRSVTAARSGTLP